MQIVSIFGDSERIAATIMINQGDASRIEPDHIPSTMLFNSEGYKADFAVLFKTKKLHNKFINLVANLRS